jgi:hypothetical protein
LAIATQKAEGRPYGATKWTCEDDRERTQQKDPEGGLFKGPATVTKWANGNQASVILR